MNDQSPISTEDARQQLRRAGLKATAQRVMILQGLYACHGHPDAERLLEHLNDGQAKLGLGTLYRCLECFVKAGLVRRFGSERGKMLFDVNTQRHHHLSLDSEPEVRDFEDDRLNRLLEDYFAQHPLPGLRIIDFQLNIRAQRQSGPSPLTLNP